MIIELLFWISLFFIFYGMVGYPLTLMIIDKFYIKEEIQKKPTKTNNRFVSIIIPAHNEEQVISEKLENLININYPIELFEIIISSDNSTDKTNTIVQKFIDEHQKYNIKLYNVKKRQGKTNAQNEAVERANGEILIFSDANAILDTNSVLYLVSSFNDDKTIYISGKLKYVNDQNNISSKTESSYWNCDLYMRKIESKLGNITAGNGALYAIKKSNYVFLDPIKCHDLNMPLYAGINNKKALYNEFAIAYEKAGETTEDEFKRKVRMFRGILNSLFETPEKYNIFQNGWFSFFYFGHRTLRYSLFINHFLLLASNIVIFNSSFIYKITLIGQIIFYSISTIGKLTKSKNKLLYFPYYYSMTIVAQLVGAYNQLAGKSKPFWEKAESTR